MKKIIMATAGLSLMALSAIAAQPAQSAKHAKDATEYRQALLLLVKSNVGALGAMNKGAIPMDAVTLETNSLRIQQLSLMLEDYFATDTSGFDVESAALAKIWQNQADFKLKIAALTDAAKNLNSVAKSGDQAQFKPAIGQIFKSCKGCHDDYKAD